MRRQRPRRLAPAPANLGAAHPGATGGAAARATFGGPLGRRFEPGRFKGVWVFSSVLTGGKF